MNGDSGGGDITPPPTPPPTPQENADKVAECIDNLDTEAHSKALHRVRSAARGCN